VKEPPKNPPQISCSASPTSVQTGGAVTISCTCTSPDNVPVTVGGWTATGGSISGSGNSATLNTTGAPAGTVTINATCTDSRGLTASSTASVTVENPPPPPPLQLPPAQVVPPPHAIPQPPQLWLSLTIPVQARRSWRDC